MAFVTIKYKKEIDGVLTDVEETKEVPDVEVQETKKENILVRGWHKLITWVKQNPGKACAASAGLAVVTTLAIGGALNNDVDETVMCESTISDGNDGGTAE